jgi:hypothetical protein
MDKGLESYVQKAGEILLAGGLSSEKLHKAVTVVEMAYPVIVELVRDRQVILARSAASIVEPYVVDCHPEWAFLVSQRYHVKMNQLSSTIAIYTKQRGAEHGVSVASLQDLLRESFGEYDKITFEKGANVRSRSKILYSEKDAVLAYIRNRVTEHKTLTVGEPHSG